MWKILYPVYVSLSYPSEWESEIAQSSPSVKCSSGGTGLRSKCKKALSAFLSWLIIIIFYLVSVETVNS